MDTSELSAQSSLNSPRDILLLRCRNTIEELQVTLSKEQEIREDLEACNKVMKQRLQLFENTENTEEDPEVFSRGGPSKILEYQGRLEQASLKNEALSSQLKKAVENIEELKDELDVKNRSMKEWEDAIAFIEDKFNTMAKEHQQSSKEVENARSTIEALKSENEYLKDTIESLKQETASQITLEGASHNYTFEELRSQISVLQKEKAESFENIKNLQEELAEYNKVCFTIKAQKEQLQSLLHTQVDELQGNLESTDKNYKELLIQKDAKLSEFDKKILFLTDKLESLQNSYELLKQSETEYFQLTQQLQKTVTEKQESISKLEKEILNLTENVRNHKNSLSVTQKEQDSLRKYYEDQLAQAHKEHRNELDLKIAQVRYEFEEEKSIKESELESVINHYFEKEEKLVRKLKTSHEEMDLLNQDRDNLKEVIKELQAKLMEILERHSSGQTGIQQLERENSVLNRKLGELSQIIEDETHKHALAVAEKDKIIEKLKTHHHKRKSANVLSHWKEKFLEEIGYLTKWSETLEVDPNQTENYEKLLTVIHRLKKCLNYSNY